jgi:hypothetical protein
MGGSLFGIKDKRFIFCHFQACAYCSEWHVINIRFLALYKRVYINLDIGLLFRALSLTVFITHFKWNLHTSKLSPRTDSANSLLKTELNQSQSQSQSHIATDGQSLCLSWCRAPTGAHDQMFLLVWKLLPCPCGAPSLTRDRVCHLSVIVDSNSPCHYVQYLQVWNYYVILCTIYTRPLSGQARYSKLCPISGSIR